MATSARFRFNATVLVSLVAVVLTLFVPGEGEPADSPVKMARLLPPPQR